MLPTPNVFAALTADGDDIDALVSDLPPQEWDRPTPARGWTIRHQIAHLSATFRMAGLAATDPAAFQQLLGRLSDDFNANVDAAMAPFMKLPVTDLCGTWQTERSRAERALVTVPGDQLVPWLVRPLPPAVLACAGMMELFGHGQDVADALGIRRHHTDRIKHLVGFAVRVWDFGYLTRQETPPDVQFRFDITGPSGAEWVFGPSDADQVISGPAVDFCLLVTRRRHRDDLALTAIGPDAKRWLTLAQAYRGPAGPGREPGQFATARSKTKANQTS